MQSFFALIDLRIFENWWKQLYVRNNGLNINHLIFADDIILLSRGSPASLNGIQRLLFLFHQSTGHDINLNKSQVFSRGENNL